MRRPPLIVGLNQTIRYDDFAFEATDAAEKEFAGRKYLVVTVAVHNQAERIDYQFRREIAAILDDQGRLFRVAPKGQQELDDVRGGPDPCGKLLPAGTSCSTQLAFELPDDSTNPRLVFRFGWLGTLLDDLLVGRQEIRLSGEK
jgi:hypothetical protein